MKKAVYEHHAKDRAIARTLLPLVAIGGGLAVSPAAALELGELTVQSSLGQPLRASIAYALAPNEMLSTTCVSVSAGRSTSGLPSIGRSSLAITERAIMITGESAIREPMLGTRVTINCPYTPNLSREYMLFVDPANTAQAQQAAATVADAAPVAAPVATPVAAPAAAPVAPRAASRTVDQTPIGQSTRYQAKPGDTLGDIVTRIENRSMKLWPAVNMIFDANPDAFIDNDPNKLKAGSWLTIPSFDGSAPVVSTASAAATEPTLAETASTAETASLGETVDGAVYEPPVLEDITEPAMETATTDATSELRPGDVILDSENPFVEPAAGTAETIIIPDTELPGPETSSSSPNVPTAIVSTGSRSESTSIFVWLIGGGLVILAGLLLFGRRVRSRFGSAPVGAAASAALTSAPSQDETENLEAIAEYDIDDDSPTAENLTLDADLILGTGLEEGTDMDVAQDFGFAQTTNLDIELPLEPEVPADGSKTDVLQQPDSTGMESILESEILPEDDDYDMSVIMDATKMPQPEDVTKLDLKAVQVSSDDETPVTDEYTINREVDFEILEQDYEEELTATQALNLEIARASADLSDTLDEQVEDEETSALPLATVTEIDVTAQLPTHDDETAAMELTQDETAEMPVRPDPNDTAAVTVNMNSEEPTAEMPVANDDETAEMEIEGGKIDTRNR